MSLNHDFQIHTLKQYFNNNRKMGKLRVIVLSGFLGSGKTTFIKNVIEYAQDLKAAIILNDISQFDMDMDLVKSKSIQFKKTKDMIEMGGGCVCCTLKDEMIKEVKKIAKSKKYDYLFIEATGISTPLPVAQAFNAHESIIKISEIYSMITVIDTENFLINLTSDKIIQEQKTKKPRRNLRNRKQHNHEHMQAQEDKPTLSELMIDQMQVANLIVLNKIDLVDKDELERIRCYIKSISPNTQIIQTCYSKVDLNNVLSVKRFDLQTAEKDSKWILEKQKIEDIPQTVKYNISSFVYEARRPFNPDKFYDVLNNKKYFQFWSHVTRAKGFFWLANYPRYSFTMQKAGARVYYQLQQPWWCEISRQFWGQSKEQKKETEKFINRFWDEKCGDKRNQIVFICQDLNKQDIIKKLDSCLIKEDEFKNYEVIYAAIEDPFKGRWSDGIKFYENQGILVDNDGDWQQFDQDMDEEEMDEQEEQAQKSQKQTKKKRKA